MLCLIHASHHILNSRHAQDAPKDASYAGKYSIKGKLSSHNRFHISSFWSFYSQKKVKTCGLQLWAPYISLTLHDTRYSLLTTHYQYSLFFMRDSLFNTLYSLFTTLVIRDSLFDTRYSLLMTQYQHSSWIFVTPCLILTIRTRYSLFSIRNYLPN